MPFSGELVNAAWLDWLRTAAPDVAAWLHEGNKRRLFTCSSLQFPLPQEKMLEVERRNVHWPLSPEKTYAIRITLLLGELFPLFHKALTDFKQTSSAGSSKPPFMRLGKQSLLLEEVVLENGDETGWTGFTSFADMVEKVRSKKLGSVVPLKLEFPMRKIGNMATTARVSHFPTTYSPIWRSAGTSWPHPSWHTLYRDRQSNSMPWTKASSSPTMISSHIP